MLRLRTKAELANGTGLICSFGRLSKQWLRSPRQPGHESRRQAGPYWNKRTFLFRPIRGAMVVLDEIPTGTHSESMPGFMPIVVAQRYALFRRKAG